MPAAKMELVVLSYNGEAPDVPLSRSFDKEELTVGRSPTNDLVLDDPDRLISRFQARIRLDRGGSATVANISSNSLILINDTEVQPGCSGAMKGTDRMLVGRYLLALNPIQATQGFAAAADPFFAQPANAYAPSAPMAVIPEDFDVFAVPAKPTESSSIGEISLADFEDPQGLARAVIDDLPLSGASELPEPLGEAVYREKMLDVSANKVDPLAMFGSSTADLLEPTGSGESFSLDHGLEVDSLFHTPAILQEAKQAHIPASLGEPAELSIDGISLGNATDSPSMSGGAPSGSPALDANDPFAALLATAVEQPEAAASRPRPTANPTAAYAPPRSGLPENATAPAAPLAAAPVSSSGEEASLRAAFARGCGIPEGALPELTPAFMETLGKIFASMTAGTIRLIHARSATKHEMRANVTIIATAGNNPLKFAPDGQSAISQLLGHRFPGFMEPLRAVEDAFDDLSAHQVGLLAGARSAMYDVVGRFSPDRLQKRLGEETLLQTLVPAMRKAKLWELYENGFTEIAGEAREEFEALFENAFARAYEQEIERIYAGREE
ncbi:type VI secretion system-associated FHA domain protein TagH [Pseudomonas sp. RIT-PI-AD]|uniref:type VI secretion system-associated FHA domain protein TagH n=1 Tax=Pseudomonas sp. RIT-PI-AD TaxID=3035294 RepID=UPI0021D97898|nr:type VI secretion system-associated FHA domain protein TagH [Pseudomonas sp. RIT-PI-AD]